MVAIGAPARPVNVPGAAKVGAAAAPAVVVPVLPVATAPDPHGGAAGIARIGPNAVTRVAEALHAQLGPDVAAEVFAAAGLSEFLRVPPEQMVDERDVITLHRALRAALDPDRTRAIARDAGYRTADYLLAHRIPAPVQALLKVLPAALASRVLLAAIRRHAWTFAGSGRFDAHGGHPSRFSVAGCPMCRDSRATRMSPSCDYYAATFERLFGVLVARDARVTETACEATGAPACTFEARW